MSDLTFEIKSHPHPRSAEERAAVMANPGFGKVFTDHMVVARYSAGRGWHDAQIKAREAIPSIRPPRFCTTRRKSSRG